MIFATMFEEDIPGSGIFNGLRQSRSSDRLRTSEVPTDAEENGERDYDDENNRNDIGFFRRVLRFKHGPPLLARTAAHDIRFGLSARVHEENGRPSD